MSALASGRLGWMAAALLHQGQEVSASTSPSNSYSGRIVELSTALGTNAGQVEILLSITDPKAELMDGGFVSIRAAKSSGQSVVAVPKSALLRTAEGNFVYTVSGERFVRAQVTLGGVDGEFAEVTDGLYAGDQIVVHPAMTLWMAELQSIRGGKACADGH